LAKFVFDLVDKAALQATMQGGYVPRQEIVKMLGTASVELFNHYLGRSDERKAGPHVGLNTRSRMALAPFVRRQRYAPNAVAPSLPIYNGQFTLPVECAYVDYYDIPSAVTVAQVEGFAKRLKRADPITGPTAQFPFISVVENGDCEVYPEVPSVTVQYFALPPAPTYVETYDENGNSSYNDTASVDVGWGREHEPDLLERTLRYVAQAIKDGQLAQTANGLTQENS
jgi:hypothetical protein